jgi:predicted dehydrogenase
MRTAVVGTGFMGRVHLEALRRTEFVDVAAIVGRNNEAAQRLGAGFGVPAADFEQVLRDPQIDAIHLCTPNAAHFAAAKGALMAGKHVLCEKPLGTTVAEGEELVALAKEKKLRNCVCHNLRCYPMVQQMRRMREAGELGDILVVQGTYSQDWLLYDTDWNWRVDSKSGGPSRAMADIGSHWFDAVEHITGQRVTSLCADLQTFHKTRKRPKGPVQTFANKMISVEVTIEESVETEDFGSVIFQMGKQIRGSMTASQVSAGRKNHLYLEIFGSEASVAWDGEHPNQLWVGYRDQPNEIVIKDPALLEPDARAYADEPGGHAEGYPDTFKQLFRRFYGSIADAKAPIDYPQFSDGLRQMKVLDAVLTSNQKRGWIDVP